MPSLRPGYEYDIFISYRQKDNKGDRWVTQFVNSLRTELETTFKEDISIYFDENPHDGLLETHHVDKSLEGKLKCLIFIPIISQTYCDQKSFAWQQEFCAFNKKSKGDQFGRDIKLGNGNVASRILPVRIHNLDASDQKMLEAEIGSNLRAVEFIYKEPGVNRPLSPDDNSAENLNKTKYKNQVNKVANAVKEIISGISNFGKPDTDEIPPEQLSPTSFAAGKSIVVLPFEDMSPEKDQEYFCHGLAEELINVLTKIKDLHVVARTSAFSFKGKEQNAQKIGRKLNVESLLEGSVRKAGNKLRITVQLINVADGFHLWSERYDREMSDVFAIQDEIAMNIVEKLKVNLLREEKQSVLKRNTGSVEAHSLYLKGRYYGMMFSEETRSKALEFYTAAVEKDPQYALAYCGLADLYCMKGLFGPHHPEEIYTKAKQYADEAMTIDPNLGEAHQASGFVKMFFERKWKEAGDYFRQALELSPGSAVVHINTALYKMAMGKSDEAISLGMKSLELDPLSSTANQLFGFIYFGLCRFDESIIQLKKALELNPGHMWAQAELGWCYAFKGMYTEARAAMEKAEKLNAGFDPWFSTTGACVFAMTGEMERARNALRELSEFAKAHYIDPTDFAVLHCCLGNHDESIRWLRKGLAERAGHMYFLRCDANLWLRSLNGDLRFREILDKLGFDPLDNHATGAPAREKSIVVLPFENMSPDKDNEYFSDGLTEELIADLSKVSQLSVISRISAMTFKGTKKKVREIATDMNVRYVLEGSVRKEENKLRITAQLIDGVSDVHLWSEKYTGTLDSVFEFQEKLSRSIVEALRIRIRPDENERRAPRSIVSVPAYEKYLQAKSEMAPHSRVGLDKARNLVNEALQITGDNELLLGTLAGIRYWSWFNGYTNEQQSPEAEVKLCMERSFHLNPDSAHGFFASGVLNYMQNKRQEAANNFRHSIEFDQSNTETMLILGILYLDVGRPEAAGPLLERILQLDPLSGLNQAMVGYLEWQNGRFQVALPFWKRSYELGPSVPPTVWSYACALASAGKSKEVIQFIDRIPTEILATPFGVMARLLKFGLIKDESQFRALLTPEFVAFAKSLPFISRDIAGYFGMIDALDEAIDWVENAINLGYINYPFLALHHPFYRTLRSHPRFGQLMDRIKQPWESFQV